MSPRLRVLKEPKGEVKLDRSFSDSVGSSFEETDGSKAVVEQDGSVIFRGPYVYGAYNFARRENVNGEGLRLDPARGRDSVLLLGNIEGEMSLLRVVAEPSEQKSPNPERF